MKYNKKLISILLVIVMAFFSCMLSSCGEDEDTPDVPVDPPAPSTQEGLSLSYSSSKISSGKDIKVTVYFNTESGADICGFQLNILSGNNYFTFKNCKPGETVKTALTVEGDVNSSNENEVRVVAYPSTKGGKATISADKPTVLAEITYTAKSSSKANFSLKNIDSFKTMLCKYDEEGKAVELPDININ